MVGARFVAVRQRLGVHRAEARRYRPFWTPTLFILDPDGLALTTWPGFIPPDELLLLLDHGEALVLLRRGRFDEAAALLDGIVERRPDSPFAPESMYWAANARYVRDADRAALDRERDRLRERYPRSAAALRA